MFISGVGLFAGFMGGLLGVATGAKPILPPIEGIDKPNVFVLRNVRSADAIKRFVEQTKPRKALVVGTGFIGLEMVENLKARGMEVSVIEMADHLMKPLDGDVSIYLKSHLLKNGIEVRLNDSVVRLEGDKTASKAVLKSGITIETDMVIMAAGIRPNVELAQKAGVEIGSITPADALQDR